MVDDELVDSILRAQSEAGHRGVLTIWTVYDKPSDHPTGFIARRHDVGRGAEHATQHVLTGDLATLRGIFIRAGLHCLPRDESDEPQIVECWL